jgi:hypothetical protein
MGAGDGGIDAAVAETRTHAGILKERRFRLRRRGKSIGVAYPISYVITRLFDGCFGSLIHGEPFIAVGRITPNRSDAAIITN